MPSSCYVDLDLLLLLIQGLEIPVCKSVCLSRAAAALQSFSLTTQDMRYEAQNWSVHVHHNEPRRTTLPLHCLRAVVRAVRRSRGGAAHTSSYQQRTLRAAAAAASFEMLSMI